MTATPAPNSIDCPDWCTEPACKGEHHASITGECLPTTGGLPRTHWQLGTYFPALTVSATWDTLDDLDPSIALHITGPDEDTQVDLRLHEAKALITAIQQGLTMLEGSVAGEVSPRSPENPGDAG